MNRTGIFGGSFNPIHNGHIALARHIMQLDHLDEMWFMVSPLNPFKRGDSTLRPDAERLALTRKALEGDDKMVASDYEFHLPRPSFTWNTLQHLSHDYPDRHFVLVIGADNWMAFDRWAHAGDILSHYELAVYPRKDYPIDGPLPPNVKLVHTPLFPLSSTEVRERVTEGLDIHGWVPENIEDDVKKIYAKPCNKLA